MQNPLVLHDCRPISVVGCIYKLLSKVVANCLKQVLPDIISPFQETFFGNEEILDGIFIANQLIDYNKCLRQEGVFLR